MSSPAHDLVALAGKLPAHYRALSEMIFSLRDAQSTRTDLAMAQDFIGSLLGVAHGAFNAPAGSIEENSGLALLYSSIVLYVRATDDKRSKRKPFAIRAKLTNQEQSIHNQSCDLRNDAVAHFGSGGRYKGPLWQLDGVFSVANPDQTAQIMTASRRLAVSPEFTGMLGQQVNRALILAGRDVEEKNTALAAAMNAAFFADPAFKKLYESCLVDLSEFFETKTAANEVLSGVRFGARRGSVKYEIEP